MKTFKIKDTQEHRSALQLEALAYELRNGEDHGIPCKMLVVELYDDQELFDVAYEAGYAAGYTAAQEKFSESEEVYLPFKYVPCLKRAIEEFEKESCVHVNTIEIETIGGEGGLAKITVHPTKGQYLFSIYKRYGQLAAAKYL